MTEQQQKLNEFVQRRNALAGELNELQQRLNDGTQLLYRLEGAIDGHQLVGIELPEAEAPEAPTETAAEAAEAALDELEAAPARSRRKSSASA